MTEQDLLEMEQHHDIADALNMPDPDPDLLPMIIPPDLVHEEQIAARIIRSTLRLDDQIEKLKVKMDADLKAYADMIASLQAKRESFRNGVRFWMETTATTQIKSPWFTVTLGKAKTRIVVDDEQAAIAGCRALGAEKAYKVTEKLVKSEFDSIFNARPKTFDGVAHEETGDPVLIVRRRQP